MVEIWLVNPDNKKPDLAAEAMIQLTENIAKTDYIGFYPTNFEAQPNYQVVPEFLRIDKRQTSQIAQVAQASVRYDAKIPKDLADRLEQIANIVNRVIALFDGDVQKAALWFRSPNPLLGEVAPRDMLRMNRFNRLAKFVTEAEQSR